jgi:hypothetical protein
MDTEIQAQIDELKKIKLIRKLANQKYYEKTKAKRPYTYVPRLVKLTDEDKKERKRLANQKYYEKKVGDLRRSRSRLLKESKKET